MSFAMAMALGATFPALADAGTGLARVPSTAAASGPVDFTTPVAASGHSFDHSLFKAYLGWAARLQEVGHWDLAEHFRTKAFAARRGDRPAPMILVPTGLGGDDRALAQAATQLRAMIGDQGGVRPQRPWSHDVLAQAQAAFDCWAGLAMDRGPQDAIEECRMAARHAFLGLGAGSSV